MSLSPMPDRPDRHDNPQAWDDLRLETRPQPTLALVACGSIAALVLIAGAAAALVPLDQIVALPGRLVTRRATQPLAAAEAGRVVEVLVREGQAVAAGAPLLRLDPAQPRVDVAELQHQLEAGEAVEQRRRLSLQQRLASLERQLQLDLQVLQPLQRLALQGGTPSLQVKEQERQVEESRRLIAETQGELESLGAEAEQVRAEQRRQLAAARQRLALQTLRAPVAGTVFNLQAQSGQVAGAGQPLLQLVPAAQLRVEAHARDDDLAFLQAGQSAQVAVNAYDPSRYGLVDARVSQVGRDALAPTSTIPYPHVPVQLELKQQVLQRGELRFALQPGMAVTAQVNLQKRTLLQLFFSRLGQGLTAVRSLR